MHTAIQKKKKKNFKNVSVPIRAWSLAAGKDFFMQSLHWRFNFHYIPPGGNYCGRWYYYLFIFLFNDNLATGGSQTGAILSCHVEL